MSPSRSNPAVPPSRSSTPSGRVTADSSIYRMMWTPSPSSLFNRLTMPRIKTLRIIISRHLKNNQLKAVSLVSLNMALHTQGLGDPFFIAAMTLGAYFYSCGIFKLMVTLDTGHLRLFVSLVKYIYLVLP